MSARDARRSRSSPAGRVRDGGRAERPGGPGPPPPMRVLRGIAVSPGVAIGPTVALDPRGLNLPPRTIAATTVAAELDRLEAGLKAASAEAQEAEADARQRLGPQYADILAAHARMVADPGLRRQARQRIEGEHVAAEHAVREILDDRAAQLEHLSDPHLAARAADVLDIEQRILQQLLGHAARPPDPLAELAGPSVVLAHDLSPSQTASLDPARVIGFATEAGGRTSHTAIVAAGLEIPAVVGLGPFLDLARASRMAILDGDKGLLILDPDPAALDRYRTDAAARLARFAELANLADLPAQTRDGTRIRLAGNIEFPAEVDHCLKLGAEGVGLYRTEFLYIGAARPPTEDEQYAAYERVVRTMAGRPVVIRTLDLGADKLSGPHHVNPARNPFLGLRSIRLSLREPELFRTQLRAILRASVLGDVRIMFPLVATLDE